VSSGDGGQTYTVDIASIAADWVADGGQNFGVAITDDPANTSTAYQVVFGPSTAIEKVQATVDYSPPTSGTGGGSVPSETPAAVGNPSSGVVSPAVPASPVLPATGISGTPPETATPPPPSTGPSATLLRPKPAAAHHSATSTPPVGFWIAAALLALLVAACILELEQPPELALATSERGVGKLLSGLIARQEDDHAHARPDA
jgi:hypothetical protein